MVLEGRSLLQHAVVRVRASGVVDEVVVVVPRERAAMVDRDLDEILDVTAEAGGTAMTVVTGGATRQESVAAGLHALTPSVDVVLVHDAARALTPPETFARVVGAVRSGHDVVVPVVDLHDTVRAVDAADASGGEPASAVVDRSTLRAVQTPQGFRRDVLDGAHAAPQGGGPAATDDATLAERAGHRVVMVDGSPEAFKVTRPVDLLLAGALLVAAPDVAALLAAGPDDAARGPS